ncbi:MAG: hypothetical protein N4A61_16930 [Pelagimonas sp.]|jgi:hypothetical protein|nr:hypothetical protein [Pelagimonas sp.]
MFLELIAVFVAGFAGAGGMMLLAKLARGRLPKWMIPVGAGAAMLAAAISNEYSWYGRNAAALPQGMVVAHTVETQAYWRPWTLLFPFTERFAAVDIANLQTNTQDANLHLANVYLYSRWKPVNAVQFMIDCANGKMADPALGDGSPPVWRDTGHDDPLVSTVCKET